MERNLSKALLATLLLVVNLAFATNRGIADQQQIPLDPSSLISGVPYIFRDAVASDINDVATVVIDAFAPAPHTQYVYQFRDRYPEYHRECMRQAMERQFAQMDPSEAVVKVIAVDDPDRAAEGESTSRVVSLGIWNLGTPNNTRVARMNTLGNPFGLGLPLAKETSKFLAAGGGGKSDFNCSAHLDLNMTRALDVQEKLDRAKAYLDSVYGRYVYLNLLATHPDWDGNGFGAAQCEWGMKLARERAQNVTLIATPAGFPLYRSLGFGDVKNVTIDMLDGLGTLWYEVMSYDPLSE